MYQGSSEIGNSRYLTVAPQTAVLDVDTQPIPLAPHATVPLWPVDALPEPIAAMVTAVTDFTQTDPAMAGTSVLSALSACTGGHAVIEVRTGWREPLNLYTVTVARPGERKSAVQQFMTWPLWDTERALHDHSLAARAEAATRKQVAELAAERAKQAAARAEPKDRDTAEADAIGAAMMAEQITVPVVPRLLADDITPEAAASLLAEQGGRLAIISAEAGVFDVIAGRYSSNIPNLDLWLKGHSGDPLRVDRKGRPPEYIPHPALTLGLMIQPAVLSAIARNPVFRGRGFLARCLFALPQSKVGHRDITPKPVDHAIVTAYNTALGKLAEGMGGWIDDPAVLMLTPDAGKAVTMLQRAIEPELRDGGELGALTDWGAKYVGAVMRIAGILHLAEYGADAGPRTPVEAVTIEKAARIGTYFKACAVNAFAQMGTDPDTADAIYLWERIEHLGVDNLTGRDMLRAAQKFHTVAELRPAIDRLVDHGHLTRIEQEHQGPGRPPSHRFQVFRTG